jgi:hypothetical protein
MFKDLPEGQTHSENDGCGEKEHNKDMPPENLPKWEEDFYEVLPIVCSPLTADSKVARIKKIFEKLLAAEKEKGKKEGREMLLKELGLMRAYGYQDAKETISKARSTAIDECIAAVEKCGLGIFGGNEQTGAWRVREGCREIILTSLHALKKKK